LVDDGRLLFQGFAGELMELPIFLTQIEVHDLPPVLTLAFPTPPANAKRHGSDLMAVTQHAGK
jgi:hypothetical protein